MKPSWKSVLKQREFWIDYFFLDIDPETWKKQFAVDDDVYVYDRENPIRMPVADGLGIFFAMGTYLPSTVLRVYGPSAPEGIAVGNFDDSHPHPAALRFVEAERLGKFLAPQVPESPEAPFLLLSNFIAITQEDDLQPIHQKFMSAWRSLGLFPDAFIREEVIDRTGWPVNGLQFAFRPETGWHCEGESDFLSLRTPDNHAFPFKLLQELLKQARLETE